MYRQLGRIRQEGPGPVLHGHEGGYPRQILDGLVADIELHRPL